MIKVNPYLNFNGTTEAAFIFYQSVFGGEFLTLQRFKETPFAGQMSDSEQEMIMHISLAIAKDTILMATDALESQGQTLVTGNNVSLAITPESLEEGREYFAKLSEGGQVTMPLEKMFWGAYFGMVIDQFGILWMVDFSEEQAE